MQEHNVDIVEIEEEIIFKSELISFASLYEYCSNTDEMLEHEDFIKSNDLAMKDAYRQKMHLLTSQEIKSLREYYGISQKDFSLVLDWGAATITRYENNQVQDHAHDTILRKLSSDPKWMAEMLERSKTRLSEKAYKEYYHRAQTIFNDLQDQYLIDAIQATYAKYDDEHLTGGVKLNLIKAVEMINYLASKLKHLHKVKLMKMLWYIDSLHFKRTGKAISGLVYCSYPMGSVPVGYQKIVLLKGICFEEVQYGEFGGFKFKPVPEFSIVELLPDEIETIDRVIELIGKLNTKEIVERMHQEPAFTKTPTKNMISYVFTTELSIA